MERRTTRYRFRVKYAFLLLRDYRFSTVATFSNKLSRGIPVSFTTIQFFIENHKNATKFLSLPQLYVLLRSEHRFWRVCYEFFLGWYYGETLPKISLSYTRSPETGIFRRGFEPPTSSCTAGRYSSRELFEQFTVHCFSIRTVWSFP